MALRNDTGSGASSDRPAVARDGATMIESMPAPRVSRARRWFAAVDNRFLAPVLVTWVLLIGHLSFGILESYTRTALAIVTAIVSEMVLGRLVYRRWPHLASAYI